MTESIAYSLMEIRLSPESPRIEGLSPYSELTRDGIDCNVSGIIGPLQYEADAVGHPDLLADVLAGFDVSGIYAEAAAMLPDGWADRTVSVYALVKIMWTTDDTPEGYFEDCDLKLDVLLHQNDLQVALLALAGGRGSR